MAKRRVISAGILLVGFICCFAAWTGSAYAQTLLPGPGIINTVAGTGGSCAPPAVCGDGAAATSAELSLPDGMAVDADGNIYIADTRNFRIRKVTVSTGVISTVAGNGIGGYSGDGGPATSAKIYPYGVAVDSTNNIYIADGYNNRIRKVTAGIISTVAGDGNATGSLGDGGSALSAELNFPTGVAVDSEGNIYIADFYYSRIRKVTDGIINTVAGSGVLAGNSGNGGPATSAVLNEPSGVALDSAGNIYISDFANNNVRKVMVLTGIISAVAGNSTRGGSGDGGAAISAELSGPGGVAVDSADNVYIADTGNERIREVLASNNFIYTVAGNGSSTLGDGGPATSAGLVSPDGVALDTSGNIYIADTNDERIRVIGSVFPSAAPVVTGTPPFGSFGGGPDVVNLSNLNVHITIPIISKQGRGTPFIYNLSYDSSVWSAGDHTWTLVPNAGWHVGTEPLTGYVSDTVTTAACGTGNLVTSTTFVFHDMYGVAHPFTGSTTQPTGACTSTATTLNATSTDGSGYIISVTGTGTVTITSRMGRVFSPPLNGTSGTGTFKDANGNEISVSGGVFTDTLGTNALTVSGTAPSPVTFTYTPPSGPNVSYTVKYASYSVETDFGCSTVTDPPATTKSLVSEIDLPDGTKYTFTYEPTTPGHPSPVTGRLASYTLPTGGTISYSYTGGSNGIECSDGSASGLNRTTPDGTWTYSRTLGTVPATTTTFTDPANTKTVINFQGIYETERQIFQTLTTLKKTIFTCYGTNLITSTHPSCNSDAVSLPISEISIFPRWPDGTNALESRTSIFYNSYGLPTEVDEYAYGSIAATPTPGSLVRKTVTTYASLGAIIGQPQLVQVIDPNSAPPNNVMSQTTYCYDGRTLSGTSCTGTPVPPTPSGTTTQLASVSTPRGNVTTIATAVQTPITSTSATLTKTFTYYDTGNVNTATDVNGTPSTTTYNYGSCADAFPVSITEPLGLSIPSLAWNCNGGVATSVTDENNQVTSIAYNDPDFWRPTTATDAASNVWDFTYTGQTLVDVSSEFNSNNSIADSTVTLDSLGRPLVSQRKQSPTATTYDSVETDYDSLGRPSRSTLPYSGTAVGQTNPSAPSVQTTYDALNRVLTTTDSGGGTTTYLYNQNDVKITVSPAPTGENTKQRQLEYDALGRLTSVCEITSATGSGTCGQTSSATGFWTKYTYDVKNNLLTVTQNAQAASGSQQTRTYTYDGLSRLTSEVNPETGTIAYTYDTDATCASTSNGDLVKKIDALGNTTCLSYDALHRPLSTTYAGPYASVTPNKFFIYDAATLSSVAMSNAKTRLAEAYTTATTLSGTKITDEYFGYSVLGQPSDVYESTPNSGMYYHTNALYWPSGAPSQISSNMDTAHLPVFTYGADGEGRINTVSANIGQNPVTATTYNVAGLPTAVTFGSTDSDSFTYDPDTNRMTQYQFTVGGQSVVGALTWNAIGTLRTLAITDPFNASNTQTCSYAHDDLTRIAGANCGSMWSQTFSYDTFGNISKNGTISFLPTYSYLTNQITGVGSSTPTYDPNGNTTNDTSRTYAWDAAGKAVTINTTGLTYDALGRMVEQAKGTGNFQIVYLPSGSKFAMMKGATLVHAFAPLPGGGQAIYIGSGLQYYRHGDWLGSSRFASKTNQTLYADTAYAPFGEPYAQSGTSDVSFTGMNQDTVSNLYDFMYREYNPTQGRWPSPDPSGLAAVDPTNPQSWNRYAYVLNNPLVYQDLLGLECVWDDGSYDSQHDPDTGEPIACKDAGGTWIDHSFFTDFELGDWSGSADSGLAAVVLGIQSGQPLVQNGPGPNGWDLAASGKSGFTFQIGLAINYSLGFLTGSGFAGIAIDSHLHVATYWGGGGGTGMGAGLSAGLQLAGSNGNSVCALGGPFTNVSGTAGYELAGTGDYFLGGGDAPGGVVQGGGVTFGLGGGGSASVQETGTNVNPFGHSCVKGQIQ